MPRPPRVEIVDGVYHVINRANQRATIFAKKKDYAAFESILLSGLTKADIKLYAFTIMPNHWHLILSPRKPKALEQYLHWITTTHVRRWAQFHNFVGTGHLYQSRYKAFLIETGDYFLTASQYIERNPLRAGLVEKAETWRWSSLWHRQNKTKEADFLSSWPIDMPKKYLEQVNVADTKEEREQIQQCIALGSPFGSATWKKTLPKELIKARRPRGRPPILE